MSEVTLRDLKTGENGTVVKVSGTGPDYRRILDMGVVKGAKIKVERVAPLGDPIEVKIKGYHLSLRRLEASCIYIKRQVDDKRIMPLVEVPSEHEVVLVAIEGGRGIKKRLTDMGLKEGVTFKALHYQGRGACIVRVGNTRLVLGHGMAQKIFVKLI